MVQTFNWHESLKDGSCFRSALTPTAEVFVAIITVALIDRNRLDLRARAPARAARGLLALVCMPRRRAGAPARPWIRSKPNSGPTFPAWPPPNTTSPSPAETPHCLPAQVEGVMIAVRHRADRARGNRSVPGKHRLKGRKVADLALEAALAPLLRERPFHLRPPFVTQMPKPLLVHPSSWLLPARTANVL